MIEHQIQTCMLSDAYDNNAKIWMLVIVFSTYLTITFVAFVLIRAEKEWFQRVGSHLMISSVT